MCEGRQHVNATMVGRYVTERVAAVKNPVVIVEDDHWICCAIRRLLTSDGLQAEEFATAEDFLQAGRAENAACLIVDISLPGMSGLELQRALAAAHKAVPIIFVSACADSAIRSSALQGGALAFLNKPFDDEALLSAIRAAIREKEL
jgi:FixJ family two-component response regulator